MHEIQKDMTDDEKTTARNDFHRYFKKYGFNGLSQIISEGIKDEGLDGHTHKDNPLIISQYYLLDKLNEKINGKNQEV